MSGRRARMSRGRKIVVVIVTLIAFVVGLIISPGPA
jgi:hypothetical protein